MVPDPIPTHIRPMTVAEIFDAGFAVVRQHWRLMVPIALVVYLPWSLATFFYTERYAGETPGIPQAIVIGVGILVFLFAVVYSSAALQHAFGAVWFGGSTTFAASYRRALSLIWPIIVTGLLKGLVAGAAAFPAVLVIGGAFIAGPAGCVLFPVGLALVALPFIVMLWYLVTTQIIVFENVSGIPCLQRSQALTKDHRLRGLGVLLLTQVVVMAVTWSMQALLAFVPILGAVLQGVVASVAAAFGEVVVGLYYFDLRSRKEGFDLLCAIGALEKQVAELPLPVAPALPAPAVPAAPAEPEDGGWNPTG